MNLYQVDLLFQLGFASVATVVVSYFLFDVWQKYKPGGLWFWLLVGLWIDVAGNVVIFSLYYSEIEIRGNIQLSAPKILVANSVNSVTQSCANLVHWVFSYKYWVVARKL